MAILVPYDGTELSRKALEHADERYEDEILALYVLDFVDAGYEAPPEAALPGYWKEWYEEAESRAETLFEEARAAVDAQVRTETALGRPAREIVQYAERDDVDAIVMGSHGRSGISRLLLGSVAETVLRRAPVPVTIVR